MAIAIITGGAQGIGKQIALSLLQKNYQLAIADIDPEAGNEILHELNAGTNAMFIPCDVSKEDQVQNVVKRTLESFGRIDLLVNNAGISINKHLTELSLEEWKKVMDTNVTSAFLFSKYCAPSLTQNKGTIINICSTRAFMSEANTEAYSASKGAIYSLTHAMAVSLGPAVRVNSISPGWIEVSELQKKSRRNTPVLSAEDHSQHPCGRVGNAKDIANMVLFLASSENGFITGQNFVIDGGMTRKMIYV